nr:hypothetical protein [Phascolarctobacterium sp.]
MKIFYKLAGLGIVAVNAVISSIRIYPGVTLVTLATIATVARMAYVEGVIRGLGL